MEGMQQSVTILRASPDCHNVAVGPCLFIDRFVCVYSCAFPAPNAQGRSANCTNIFPAPENPPGCYCLEAAHRNQPSILIYSASGASASRRGHSHIPCQYPAHCLMQSFLLAMTTNLVHWATLLITNISFIHFIDSSFCNVLVSLIHYFLQTSCAFVFPSPLLVLNHAKSHHLPRSSWTTENTISKLPLTFQH